GKNITLSFDPEPGLYIYAEDHMLKTVIRNLVSNAIKYSVPGGKVTIAASMPTPLLVEVRVTDSGIGMAPETLEGLFKLNKNASVRGTAGETGTGLGLVICKEFIEKNNGRIWAESEPGKGSSFAFEVLAYI
ncbi:MAG TPA: HAMP domain-containing sensor histidine kinase, partial [Candidatus Wallbacteria bacterium]|nr:HAMP domain-containing sensor histidine kinase [Candidatus Wallbacteria bacterium]